MTSERKKHYPIRKEDYLSGRRQNISYVNWVYETCGRKKIEKFSLQLARDANQKQVKEIFSKHLEETYESCLLEKDIVVTEYKRFVSNIQCFIEEKDERVVIDACFFVNRIQVLGTTKLVTRVVNELQDILPLQKQKKKTKDHISVIVPARTGGLTTRPFPIKRKKICRRNYDSKVQEAYKRTIENFKSENPPGRFLLLKGLPGTGKTYFIRALIGSVEGDKIFVPSHMAASLSGPALLKVLLEGKRKEKTKQILIFEDAENLILKRQIDNSSFVSTVLNFADGFLAELTDTYIVASTNISEEVSIDPAILRPGRLMEKIEFPGLAPDQANSLYHTLTGDKGSFQEPVTLAEVYLKVKGGKLHEEDLRKPVGFTAGSE